MSKSEEGQRVLGDAGSSQGGPASEPDPDSTVGVGSVFAIGCTLLMMVILLIGIGIFVARQVN